MSEEPTLSTSGAVQAEYHASLRDGVFVLPRCQDCQQVHFYPRAICPFCACPDLEWVPAEGGGTVYSTTVVRSRRSVHNVALIDLAEGPRMMSRVEGIAPEDIRIGMPVRSGIITTDDGERLVVLTPADGGTR